MESEVVVPQMLVLSLPMGIPLTKRVSRSTSGHSETGRTGQVHRIIFRCNSKRLCNRDDCKPFQDLRIICLLYWIME